jgi:hypothetical protein
MIPLRIRSYGSPALNPIRSHPVGQRGASPMTCPTLLSAIVEALRNAGDTEEIIAAAIKAGGAFQNAPRRQEAARASVPMVRRACGLSDGVTKFVTKFLEGSRTRDDTCFVSFRSSTSRGGSWMRPKGNDLCGDYRFLAAKATGSRGAHPGHPVAARHCSLAVRPRR